MTNERRDELARTWCRFCREEWHTPLRRKEHEPLCDLAWGDVEP